MILLTPKKIASTLLEDGFDAKMLSGIDSILTIIREFHDSLDGLASGFCRFRSIYLTIVSC